MRMPQAQLVYTCNLSIWEVEAEGWRIHKFILTKVSSSRPDWAPGDPASKTKQNKWQQIPQFLKVLGWINCPDLHTVKSYHKLLLCCPCSCLAVLWLGWEVGGWVASWALEAGVWALKPCLWNAKCSTLFYLPGSCVRVINMKGTDEETGI